MPVTPNSRCSTIAEAICNLRRNQLDELAFELLERDRDWAEALGKRLTGKATLRVAEAVAGDSDDPDFEVKDEVSLMDAPEGNLFPTEVRVSED